MCVVADMIWYLPILPPGSHRMYPHFAAQVYPMHGNNGTVNKVTVYESLAIQSIRKVDLLSGTLELNVWLRLAWNDPRYVDGEATLHSVATQ